LDPFTLLAAVVGTAISTALKPEKFAEIAIGGILGNRVDANTVRLRKKFKIFQRENAAFRFLIEVFQGLTVPYWGRCGFCEGFQWFDSVGARGKS
jgi:hypothetical protein